MLYAEDDREGQARARAFREDPPATIFAHADEVLE
jgi:hypothetical protein